MRLVVGVLRFRVFLVLEVEAFGLLQCRLQDRILGQASWVRFSWSKVRFLMTLEATT